MPISIVRDKFESMNRKMTFKSAMIFQALIFAAFSILFTSCSQKAKPASKETERIRQNQSSLSTLLEKPDLDEVSRYAIVKQMANNLVALNDTQSLILFLTDWVEKNPSDTYNAYWLLMTAYAYMSENAEPIAEYYFDRILKDYADLLVNGSSIHLSCLQNLIQISTDSRNRIKYFNELINRFPANVSITELYLRLALEYEKESEWDEALKAYSIFLAQPDASSIQISGEPNAYKKARQFVSFSSSSKDWTFESLEALSNAVKQAISRYDWRSLDKYKAKVNFFSMSWKQDEMDPNAQEEFSMRNFMRGQRVRYSAELDSDSNSNEAYLRTWGWSTYVPVWYFYFRKVNFPLDPDINGNWEWAGIYMGEKL